MIVIPMAGMSRRFTDAGYDRPKYELELHGRTVFSHAVGSFAAYAQRESFLFIVRRDALASDFIARETQRLGLRDVRTIELPVPTLGQADTVRLGLEAANADDAAPLTIFNIDTFRPGFAYPSESWMNVADGYLEVMHGSDPGFSYVLPKDRGSEQARVAQTAEKRVISDLASTGLYWFRRTKDFLRAMQEPQSAAGEIYVAPLFNKLLSEGADIRFKQVPVGDVIFCGTPQQYEALRRGRSPDVKEARERVGG